MTIPHPSPARPPTARWLFYGLVLFALAATVRVALVLKPGLWADEIFSLAMATGHSLEHPAEEAVAELGDFMEPDGAVPAATFRRYTQHEEPAAGPRRVIRAVFLSDTNPPLYYLLLNGWTRLAGTTDASLRGFSAVCGLLSIPLLWQVGRMLGGARIAWIATVLFAFSPAAVYYSAEGRMYSLLWFLALTLAWSTLRLREEGSSPVHVGVWCAAGAAGLLTHYFFVFAWLGCIVWLLSRPGRYRWSHIAVATGAVVLLILPWYVLIPASLARWRVSAGWLEDPLTVGQAMTAPILLAWNFLSSDGLWGGSKWLARLAAAAYAALLLVGLRRDIRPLVSGRWLLVWLWFAGTIFGPVAFDLIQGTSTSRFARYALPGLPAAMLLVALGVTQLKARSQIVFVGIILLLGSEALVSMLRSPARPWQPFPEVANRLDQHSTPGDVIIVHSIPSGVIGLARYLRSETPVASWVTQLEKPQGTNALESLLSGSCRAMLVKIHILDQASPAEDWLRAHAVLTWGDSTVLRDRWLVTELLYFQPRGFADTPATHCPDWHTPAASGPQIRAR